MKDPIVSIIVPVYNVEKYIDRCVQSLLKQTLENIEIILVDDGSPDNCPQICNSYANKDNRIKVIHKPNEGLGYARNSGLKVAKGRYVAFVDSDDFVSPNMYEELIMLADRYKLDTVFCGYNYYNKDGDIIRKNELERLSILRTANTGVAMLKKMLSSDNKKNIVDFDMCVWRAIYSRKIIENSSIRFVSERNFISEDIIFHIDYLAHTNSIGISPKCYYFYCLNGNSLTKSYRYDRFEKEKILFEEILKRVKKYNLPISVPKMTNFFALKTRYVISQEIEHMPTLTYDVVYQHIKVLSKDSLVKKYIYANIGLYPFKYKVFFLLLEYGLIQILMHLAKLKS